jgi:2-octaprenyl-6-methoxyphenol hydroxylase
MTNSRFEVAVVGGGAAGLTAAIALAGAGIETALVAKSRSGRDHRTTALLAGSVTALDTLGVWQRCQTQAAPLRVLRIIDDTGRLLRAPEVAFDAREIGLDAFGHNIENHILIAALAARARELTALTQVEDQAAEVEIDADGVTIGLKTGAPLSARLAIGADGRDSVCRAAAGIGVDRRSYPQTALTFNLSHSREHDDTSIEFHTRMGPFTLVPLPGRRSSLVFVVDPAEVARLRALTDADMGLEIEQRSHSILGKIAVEPGRGVFSLLAETADRFGARRVALIGEAAHVVAPIGAQGLNLGLRDAATIAELVVAARRASQDIGDVTERYDAVRRADVTGRTLAVDILNRSLLSDFLPLQGARGLGLFLMQHVGPLRRSVMREGVAPLASQPRLMRGEAL